MYNLHIFIRARIYIMARFIMALFDSGALYHGAFFLGAFFLGANCHIPLCTGMTARLKCEVLSKIKSNHYVPCPWVPKQRFRKSEPP